MPSASSASPDPYLLPSITGGAPINLLSPSPFGPTAHRAPLRQDVRAVVDAFVAQHGFSTTASLRAKLAAYLNIDGKKLKTHLAGKKRKATAESKKREEREAARERDERRVREALVYDVEQEKSNWATLLGEWDAIVQERRRLVGLEWYWSTGGVWVDGNDIRDVPPPPSAIDGPHEDASSDYDYDLVDALLRQTFGHPDVLPSDHSAEDDHSSCRVVDRLADVSLAQLDAYTRPLGADTPPRSRSRSPPTMPTYGPASMLTFTPLPAKILAQLSHDRPGSPSADGQLPATFGPSRVVHNVARRTHPFLRPTRAISSSTPTRARRRQSAVAPQVARHRSCPDGSHNDARRALSFKSASVGAEAKG